MILVIFLAGVLLLLSSALLALAELFFGRIQHAINFWIWSLMWFLLSLFSWLFMNR